MKIIRFASITESYGIYISKQYSITAPCMPAWYLPLVYTHSVIESTVMTEEFDFSICCLQVVINLQAMIGMTPLPNNKA